MLWEVVHVTRIRIIYHGKNIMGSVYGIKSKRDNKFMGSKYKDKKVYGKELKDTKCREGVCKDDKKYLRRSATDEKYMGSVYKIKSIWEKCVCKDKGRSIQKGVYIKEEIYKGMCMKILHYIQTSGFPWMNYTQWKKTSLPWCAVLYIYTRVKLNCSQVWRGAHTAGNHLDSNFFPRGKSPSICLVIYIFIYLSDYISIYL